MMNAARIAFGIVGALLAVAYSISLHAQQPSVQPTKITRAPMIQAPPADRRWIALAP